jgi:YVTN family beta-propeller protein
MAAVNPPTRIGFIERSSMDIDEVEVFHPRPHALAVDPTGRYVLSGSLGENRIMVIDTETGDAERYSLEGPVHTLVQFAISPDGSTMIVGGQLTGKLFFFDTTSLPALPLTKTIDVNPAPWHPVFAPDGRSAYIANKMSNTVSVVDMNRRDVSDVISGTGLSQPHGAALSHDGRYLYISSNNLDGAYSPRHDFGDNALDGTVSVIDTSTLQIVKVLEVGPYAAGAGSRAAQ